MKTCIGSFRGRAFRLFVTIAALPRVEKASNPAMNVTRYAKPAIRAMSWGDLSRFISISSRFSTAALLRADLALLVVPAAYPEYVPVTLLGKEWICRGGCYLRNTAVLIDPASRYRTARIEMPYYPGDARVDKLVSHGHGLLGVMLVVFQDKLDLLACHPALRHPVLDGKVCAVFVIDPVLALVASHRPGNTDFYCIAFLGATR